MDTHIATAQSLADHEDELSARLPGEPDDPGILHAPSAPGPRAIGRPSTVSARKRHVPGWLAGVAIVALLAGGAGFVVSPYNHVIPLPAPVTASVHRLAAQAGIDLDRPLAPAASLARVNLPPAPSPVVIPRYQPRPRDATLREILGLRLGAGQDAGGGASNGGQGSGLRSGPSTAAAPAASPRVQQQPDPASTPRRQPALRPSAEPSPLQAGFVPHEPGSPLGQPALAAAPTLPPVPSPAASPGHRPSDVTQAVVAAATAHGSPASSATAALEPGAAPADAASPAPAAARPSAALPSQETQALGTANVATANPAGSEVRAAPVAASSVVRSPGAAGAAGAVDPVESLRRMRPAPMTSSDQLQVLQMVAQMATMVRDMKQQNAALRADVARVQEDERTRLQDFERRVDVAEARAALESAAEPAAAAPPAPVNQVAARAISITRAAAALPAVTPANLPAQAKRYRVQAASPGLALLAEVDRGGGDGAQVQVVVGDSLPGWGKVKSVAQRGSSWVVATEHGVIR